MLFAATTRSWGCGWWIKQKDGRKRTAPMLVSHSTEVKHCSFICTTKQKPGQRKLLLFLLSFFYSHSGRRVPVGARKLYRKKTTRVEGWRAIVENSISYQPVMQRQQLLHCVHFRHTHMHNKFLKLNSYINKKSKYSYDLHPPFLQDIFAIISFT